MPIDWIIYDPYVSHANPLKTIKAVKHLGKRSSKPTNHKWKIVIGHHPLYSSSKRYGKTDAIRRVLEPVLHQHNVKLS